MGVMGMEVMSRGSKGEGLGTHHRRSVGHPWSLTHRRAVSLHQHATHPIVGFRFDVAIVFTGVEVHRDEASSRVWRTRPH